MQTFNAANGSVYSRWSCLISHMGTAQVWALMQPYRDDHMGTSQFKESIIQGHDYMFIHIFLSVYLYEHTHMYIHAATKADRINLTRLITCIK